MKHANIRRKRLNEPVFRILVVKSDLVEPGNKVKKQLNLEGIQSTHGVTYFRDIDKIINHIYPDVDDRRDYLALEVSKRPIESAYVRLDDDGNPKQNFLLEPYEEVKDIVIDVKKIDRTERQRDTWETLAQAYRERNQELLPLGGI